MTASAVNPRPLNLNTMLPEQSQKCGWRDGERTKKVQEKVGRHSLRALLAPLRCSRDEEGLLNSSAHPRALALVSQPPRIDPSLQKAASGLLKSAPTCFRPQTVICSASLACHVLAGLPAHGEKNIQLHKGLSPCQNHSLEHWSTYSTLRDG